MKRVSSLCLGVAIGAVAASPLPAQASNGTSGLTVYAFTTAQAGRSVITGTVFVEAHRPIADIWIELLDDFNSTISRLKTDPSGRFTFGGLINGNYRLRVLPYGTDYKEQVQEVTLASVSAVSGRPGTDRQTIDIYLKRNDRAPVGPFAVGPRVVFVQEVPPEAERLYEEGVRLLRDKKEREGFESLKKSLEVFPTYYLALDRLGAEYAMRGNKDRSYWEAARLLLEKAVEVNPSGINSVFGLGWTQYQLGMNAQAITSMELAVSLNGKSPDAFLWLGKAQLRVSAVDKAEVAFKKANELTKGKVAEIHKLLAKIYSDQKRYREAADELELYLKTTSDDQDDAQIHALIKQMRAKATS
ncbi:MAG: carboxypeptidase regulatory-like domain-containing protein [Pyrinomonadaceae bacterium]